jgi:GNAT superfamily N-acetyltransferase
MQFAVALQYPNGRTVEAVLTSHRAPEQGTQFEMHGHTWVVTGLVDSRHADRLRRKVDPKAESTRILCVRVDESETATVAQVSVRFAVIADAPALRELFRRSSLSNEGDRANLLAHPDALALSDLPIEENRVRVAVVEDRIVGFATVLVTGQVGELDDLFVDPIWMEQGVGRILVSDAIANARDCGLTRIEVTANDGKERVNGSSPLEGFCFSPARACFCWLRWRRRAAEVSTRRPPGGRRLRLAGCSCPGG